MHSYIGAALQSLKIYEVNTGRNYPKDVTISYKYKYIYKYKYK